jgi:nucleoside-diphosphate-sugar epimerase
MSKSAKEIVLITGAAGSIGTALARALSKSYTPVGFDLEGREAPCELIGIDLTSDAAVELAIRKFRDRFGDRIASVIHLAAYFDFTGEESPLYEAVNVEGTRRLLRALRPLEVEQFVYAGTMLVHRPGRPGQPIDESAPIEPAWAYPRSKARTEKVIAAEYGDIPYVLLHCAGVYDDTSAVPTLARQITSIYERDLKSHFYPADLRTGQSMVHMDDLIDAVRRAIDRRKDLPSGATILIGEPRAMSFAELQDTVGKLIHGEREWATIEVAKPLAVTGAWLEAQAEPLVPDAFDQGEKPFIRPFMVMIADAHYELDISRAREQLGWEPRRSIRKTLPKMIEALKRDPLAWYERNGITPPPWLKAAAARSDDPEALRARHEARYRAEHRQSIWGAFLNMALGTWLMTSGPILGYASTELAWSDFLSGMAVLALGFVSLSWRFGLARWATAAVGLWLLFAPLIFWAPGAAAYLNDTLVGALVIGFAVLTRPPPGVGLVASETGPTIPPGWDYSPSGWFQRLPIIVLALVGLYVSRYLAAYQLGHIDGVWEPFFAGGPDAKNGTEEIITSSVSRAWAISDAGLGGITYMLEILTGFIGSNRRWRTMPWLVVLFGILIVPLGVVSITFIIIQPIVIGTWCTLCLIAAAAMLVQIPYSLDELLATGQFLWRRKQAGRPLLRVFLLGDSDEGDQQKEDDFEQSPAAIIAETVSGGVSLPRGLAGCVLIGAWLMFTPLTLGTTGGMAHADHLIGSLVLTITISAHAEVARPLRYLNIPLGVALLVTPFVYSAAATAMIASVVSGLALILLSLPRGPIHHPYGDWNRYLV